MSLKSYFLLFPITYVSAPAAAAFTKHAHTLPIKKINYEARLERLLRLSRTRDPPLLSPRLRPPTKEKPLYHKLHKQIQVTRVDHPRDLQHERVHRTGAILGGVVEPKSGDDDAHDHLRYLHEGDVDGAVWKGGREGGRKG